VATRFYYSDTAAPVSVTPAAGWDVTANAGTSGLLSRTRTNYGGAAFTASQPGTGGANEDALHVVMVSDPIVGATITGTVKGQIFAREANTLTDARAQIVVKVVSNDGSTVRGTLIDFDTAALSSEFNISGGTIINRKFPRGGAVSVTSVAAQNGDRIVVEVGHRNHGTNTGVVRINAGATVSPTTDAPEDETTDDAAGSYAGWLEFSQTLTPYDEAPAGVATGTGSALVARGSVKASAGIGTGTGAAYNAAGSLLPPPRTVLINGSDYTESIRLDSFSFTECANRGEVGTGGIDVHDATSALEVPALKAVQFDEPQAGQSNKRVFTGFTHERTTERGIQRAAGVREWGVELVDLNVLADDFVLTTADSADRGSETDYARIIWLLTTAGLTAAGVGNGAVVNANTVTMEAADYRGRKPRDVLAECSEAAGKLWFIYDYGAGRKLYYDLATGTSLSSSAKISDVDTDVNSTTVWAPSTVTVKRSPDRIFSKIHLTYNAGVVTASDAAVATAYRTREAAILDASIVGSTLAQAKADELLANSSEEITEVQGLSVVMPALYVNDIRVGQRVEIKLTRHGVDAYTWFRVIRRTVTPFAGSDVVYTVTLGLASNVLAAATGGRGGDEIWPHKSNAHEDGATVRVDRGGLTITEGGITVSNTTGDTIFDASLNGGTIQNDSTTVIIDDAGITITDGSLILQDEFATTVMESTGFSGPWTDFIRLGLYNARFVYGNVGVLAEGRTADLPYWTVDNVAGGVATLLSGGGIKTTFSALSGSTTYDSDLVPVRPGSTMEAGVAYLVNRAAGTLLLNGFIYWFQADGSASATPSVAIFDESATASITSLRWITTSVVVPSDAVLGQLVFYAQETVSHNAANSVTVYAAKLIDAPLAIPAGVYLAGVTYVTPSGTDDDYDPGTPTAEIGILIAGTTAAWTLRGMLAPTTEYKMMYLYNYSANNITIKHDNAGSAAANRFYTPGAVDLVLGTWNGCLLLYNTLVNRWAVLANS
jgi:hypothetical protein